MTKRFMIISADCHAAAPWPAYEPYFERNHLDPFREWYGASAAPSLLRPGEKRLFDTAYLDELDESKRADGRSGTWDPEVRMRELDADGVAGEIIFPGAQNYHVPFHGRRPGTQRTEKQPPELLQAGARAYNRWLADLCAQNPDRCAGVAFVAYHHIDAAVEEIRWARAARLRAVQQRHLLLRPGRLRGRPLEVPLRREGVAGGVRRQVRRSLRRPLPLHHGQRRLLPGLSVLQRHQPVGGPPRGHRHLPPRDRGSPA